MKLKAIAAAVAGEVGETISLSLWPELMAGTSPVELPPGGAR